MYQWADFKYVKSLQCSTILYAENLTISTLFLVSPSQEEDNKDQDPSQ